MHLADVLSVLKDSNPEWLHNTIVDVFHMILEGAPIFPPHDIFQLGPQLLLKVGAVLQSIEYISRSIDSVHFGPIPKLFRGPILCQYQSPLISS